MFEEILHQENFPYGRAAQLATILWRRLTSYEAKVGDIYRTGTWLRGILFLSVGVGRGAGEG